MKKMYTKNILVGAYANSMNEDLYQTPFTKVKRSILQTAIKAAAKANGMNWRDYVCFNLTGKAYAKEDWT